MALFCSFSWLSSTPLCTCARLLYPFLCRRSGSVLPYLSPHDWCCCERHKCVYLFKSVFSGYMPRRGTVDRTVALSFLWNSTLFSTWLYQFAFPPAAREGSFFSQPLQHGLFADVLMLAVLTGCEYDSVDLQSSDNQ